jgi:hypothetical protein
MHENDTGMKHLSLYFDKKPEFVGKCLPLVPCRKHECEKYLEEYP